MEWGFEKIRGEGTTLLDQGGNSFSLAFIIMIKYTKMKLVYYDSSNLMNFLFFFHRSLLEI